VRDYRGQIKVLNKLEESFLGFCLGYMLIIWMELLLDGIIKFENLRLDESGELILSFFSVADTATNVSGCFLCGFGFSATTAAAVKMIKLCGRLDSGRVLFSFFLSFC
jgi:hypothetical protein